jgi:hypothetical protein
MHAQDDLTFPVNHQVFLFNLHLQDLTKSEVYFDDANFKCNLLNALNSSRFWEGGALPTQKSGTEKNSI